MNERVVGWRRSGRLFGLDECRQAVGEVARQCLQQPGGLDQRRLQRAGHRFQSDCDSEIIAVYLAQKMSEGLSLEDAMHRSLTELDGVFTYICVTEDELGVAKDQLGAKPLVLYESDDIVALASEEIAIRKVIDREIETYDPYEGAVMVWTR